MSVVILNPQSNFVGVVEDDHGRPWRLYSAPSIFRGGVYIRATHGARTFGGDFLPAFGGFDDLTEDHGQSLAFINRIRRHLSATLRGYALASRVA